VTPALFEAAFYESSAMYSAHYRTRRLLIIAVSIVILCLSIAAIVLNSLRSHALLNRDDLYWILD
jgi:hypothetical protein